MRNTFVQSLMSAGKKAWVLRIHPECSEKALIRLVGCPVQWLSSHYAVTHVRNENSNIQGRSPIVVEKFHAVRNLASFVVN